MADVVSFAKDSLTIAASAAGTTALVVVAFTLIRRCFTTKPIAYGLQPFVVAPELDTKIGAMVRMSLHMELQRAAVLLARRVAARPPPPRGGPIEMVVGGPDTTIGMSKSSATPEANGAASLEFYKTVRGITYSRLNPALARIKELGTISGTVLQPGEVSGVIDSQMVGDDAIKIEDGKVTIVALKLLALLRGWKPMRFRQEVTGHVRCVDGRLRVVAALGPERALLLPHWVPHLLRHLLTGRRSPLLTAQVFECTSAIPALSDMSAAASAVGTELAHKLLAETRKADWQAVGQYVAAVADYDAGVSEKDSTKLRKAIERAKKVHRFSPDFDLLPDLLVAISDRLSGLQDLDAAERALSVLPRHKAHVDSDEATRRALQVLTRLGSIYYRQGRFEEAISVFRQARTMSEDAAYRRRRVLPGLAAALAGLSNSNRPAKGGKRDEHRDEAVRLVEELVCHRDPLGVREVVRATRDVLREPNLVLSGGMRSRRVAEATWSLADYLARISLFEEALDKYREANKVFPDSKYLAWRCGVMCLYLKRGNDAEKYFRTAIRMGAKQSAELLMLPGFRYRRDVQSQPKADAWWSVQALEDWSYHLTDNNEQTDGRADRSIRQRKAQKLLGLALRYAPNEWDVHYNLAWAKQRMLDDQGSDPGNGGEVYAEVKRSYDRAMVLGPTEVLPSLGTAMLLEREGVHSAALEHYRAARANAVAEREFDVKPTATLCIQGEVRILERLGRFEEAIATLEAEAAVDPENPVVELYLGFLKAKRDLLRNSLFDASYSDEYLRHVWRSRSLVSGVQTRFNSESVLKQADDVEANIRRWMGQPDLARPYLERCQEQSEYACASLSLMAHEAGDHAGARKLREKAEKLRPPKLPPRSESYYRACIAAMIGNVEEAIPLLRDALGWQPGTREWARVDPDLARISEDRKFEALVGPRNATPNGRPGEASQVSVPGGRS